MSVRVTTAEHANAFVLARQHLITPAPDIPTAVERLLCVQTQYDISLYTSMAMRVADSTAAAVEHALQTARTIVKTWTVRSTLHTVSANDLAFFAAAVGNYRYPDLERWQADIANLTPTEVSEMNDQILAALADGPRSREEIYATVPLLHRVPYKGWGTDVKALVYRGEVVFGAGKTFARRDHWLPDLAWDVPPADSARLDMLRRFFAAYGPASIRDVAQWAGWYITTAREVMQDLLPELLPLHIPDWPETHYILASDEAAYNATSPDAIPDLVMLPKFDVISVAYKHKNRWVDEAHRTAIYRIAGQIEGAVLWRGRMVGAWRHTLNKKALTVRVEPFKKLNKTQLRHIQRAAEHLARFYDRPTAIVEITDAF